MKREGRDWANCKKKRLCLLVWWLANLRLPALGSRKYTRRRKLFFASAYQRPFIQIYERHILCRILLITEFYEG